MGKGLYNFVWLVSRPYYSIFHPCRVTGLENLPAEGGFVLCANHMSARDPIFISSHLPMKRMVRYLGKKQLTKTRFTNALMRGLGMIPVDRGHADLSAVRASLQVLKEGFALGIFPQGTRSRDNSRTPMLNGASMIALRGGVPVVPLYIDGPYRLFRRTDIRIGRPIALEDLGKRVDSDTLNEVTRRIDDNIWGLCPTALPQDAQ